MFFILSFLVDYTEFSGVSGFPKVKSPFFDKNVRKTDFIQFVALSGCFQPFRLENEWSCVLLCQMFPPVPETSVVSVVVIDQASPEYPARLD